MALSDKKEGSYIPNFTTDEIVGITSATGMIIYNSTTKKIQVYDGTSWNDV